jgi:hypothetical protein
VAVLFTDVEGQPLRQVGRLSDRHKAALSTLAAGSVGASVAMASLLGQAGTFEKSLFEKKDHSVYSSAVAQNQAWPYSSPGKPQKNRYISFARPESERWNSPLGT